MGHDGPLLQWASPIKSCGFIIVKCQCGCSYLVWLTIEEYISITYIFLWFSQHVHISTRTYISYSITIYIYIYCTHYIYNICIYLIYIYTYYIYIYLIGLYMCRYICSICMCPWQEDHHFCICARFTSLRRRVH